MTSDAAAPVPSRQIHTTDELTEDQAATVLTLLADAAAEDGQQAVSEQGRLQLRGGRREGVRHLLLTADGQLAGYAQLEGADPVEPHAASWSSTPRTGAAATAGRWAPPCWRPPAARCDSGRTAATRPPATWRRCWG